MVGSLCGYHHQLMKFPYICSEDLNLSPIIITMIMIIIIIMPTHERMYAQTHARTHAHITVHGYTHARTCNGLCVLWTWSGQMSHWTKGEYHGDGPGRTQQYNGVKKKEKKKKLSLYLSPWYIPHLNNSSSHSHRTMHSDNQIAHTVASLAHQKAKR